MIRSNKPVVYIASPYTKGWQLLNVRSQAEVFDDLMNDGVVYPIIPLAMSLVHLLVPRSEPDWIAYDLVLLEKCDAVLRLNAKVKKFPEYEITESKGSDGEVARAQELKMPVFYDKESLYQWAASWWVAKEPKAEVVGEGLNLFGLKTTAPEPEGQKWLKWLRCWERLSGGRKESR